MDRLKEQVESTAPDDPDAGRAGAGHRRDHRHGQRHRRADQPAGPERRHRGQPRRRARPGFAVVAEEVKALADQSKKATTQVRQILGEIQKATNTAVLSTEEVTKGVAAAIKAGGQSNQTVHALSRR
jgi:hypothetical protein